MPNPDTMVADTDVVVIGSGFGASVAALRWAEAGYRVTVLERGGWVSRDSFEADGNLFWLPERGYYGMNDFRKRGRHIIPWLGTGVGGGSHVYAATLKRRVFFDDFPDDITVAEMAPYYERSEAVMGGVRYPDYPPYNQLPSYRLFREAEKKFHRDHPELVEEEGDILLGVAFAPPGGTPGEPFINEHGAPQRYSDPDEQKLLGGDIDVKNTLDKNYLHLAQAQGAVIRPFAEVDRIETLPEGSYRVHWTDPRQETAESGHLTAQIVVCGAGAIGSTELLLRNKERYGTLPDISDQLGKTYFANGDYVTFLVPKRGLLLSWLGVLALIVAIFTGLWWLAAAGLVLYGLGWWRADPKSFPDRGTTNSDYIRFKRHDGGPQGVYLEGGRYPTPIKALAAIFKSLFGDYHPSDYAEMNKGLNWMGKYLPFYELIERSWPIPILMMGRDDAVGHFTLDEENEAVIHFPYERNRQYLDYLDRLGRLFSRYADSYFIPNKIAEWLHLYEIPHNMGGISMGEDAATGVVDSYGRVFHYDNLMVLDGSIMPASLGANPVGTILAFAERGSERAIQQFKEAGRVRAEAGEGM